MKILGINFFTGGETLLPILAKEGGLVSVPSGPGLAVDLVRIPIYRRALLESNFVIPDSGFMVIVWNIMNLFHPKNWIKRYSGLGLIRDLLKHPSLQPAGSTFWVMPSEDDCGINLSWLKGNGLPNLVREDCYVAPFYRDKLGPDGKVEDQELLELIVKRKPRYVFLNVGSGVQEQLGLYLKENLPSTPAILCTGAAIAFLTGAQASIPTWADRYCVGWFLRILQDPVRFGTRYWKAIRLLQIIAKNRANLPPAEYGK